MAGLTSIFATSILFACLFPLAMLLFELLRIKFPDIYSPLSRDDSKDANIKQDEGLFRWVQQVYSLDEERMLRLAGMDGYVLLRFLLFCFKLCVLISIGSIFLVPVYLTAASPDTSYDINRFSMANIAIGGDRLWTSFLFVYLYTVAFLLLLNQENNHIIEARNRYCKYLKNSELIPEQMRFTVFVEQIPKEYGKSYRLLNLFEKCFPGEVLHANILDTTYQLEQLVKSRNRIVTALESAVAVYEADPLKRRPVMYLLRDGAQSHHLYTYPFMVYISRLLRLCGYPVEEVDCIAYWTDQLLLAYGKVQEAQMEALHITEGGASSSATSINASAAVFTNDNNSTGSGRFNHSHSGINREGEGKVEVEDDLEFQHEPPATTTVVHTTSSMSFTSRITKVEDVISTTAATTGAGKSSSISLRAPSKLEMAHHSESALGTAGTRMQHSQEGEEGEDGIEMKHKINPIIPAEVDEEMATAIADALADAVQGLVTAGAKARAADKKRLLSFDPEKVAELVEAAKHAIVAQFVTTSGFVTFSTRTGQKRACEADMKVLLGKTHSAKGIKIRPAPAPSDLIWKNLPATTRSIRSANFLVTVTYYSCLAVWSVVLAFIASLTNLSRFKTKSTLLENMDDLTFAILQGVLPAAVMIAFNILCSFIMKWISRKIERRKTQSIVELEVFKWQFYFQIYNIYLILVASVATTDVGTPFQFISLLSAALPQTAAFFINFIITYWLGSVLVILIRLSSTIQWVYYTNDWLPVWVQQPLRLTRNQLMKGPLAPCEVDYSTILPNYLYVLCIVLLFWVVAPIVPLVGMGYFFFIYLAYKYKYAFLASPSFESGGAMWHAIYRYSMMGLLASTIFMVFYMGIKHAFIQTPLLLPLILIILAFWRRAESQFEQHVMKHPLEVVLQQWSAEDDASEIAALRQDSNTTKSTTAATKAPGNGTSTGTASSEVDEKIGSRAEVLTEKDEEKGEEEELGKEKQVDVVGNAAEEKESTKELLQDFQPDMYRAPSVVEPARAYPYPHRILDIPLLTPVGALDEVYIPNIPAGVDPDQYVLSTIANQERFWRSFARTALSKHSQDALSSAYSRVDDAEEAAEDKESADTIVNNPMVAAVLANASSNPVGGGAALAAAAGSDAGDNETQRDGGGANV